MAFHFPLDSLLRLRRSLQRQQELALQRRNNEVNRLRLSLEQNQADAAHVSGLPANGRSGAEIGFDRERVLALARRRREIEAALATAIADRDQAAAKFRRAWQSRETLETLRRHAHDTFTVEQSRREQRALDDWFLGWKRHGSGAPFSEKSRLTPFPILVQL